MIPVPSHLQRLADQIDGWLDLRCPERVLDLLPPMLADPQARPAGLAMRVRAYVRQARCAEALLDLAELRTTQPAMDWIDLTEAWCRKRTADLRGAIRCMEQLLERNARSDIGHYNHGCYLALDGQRDRAIDEVTVACGMNAEFRDHARDEPDLDSLRTDARFRQLMRQGGAAREAAAGDGSEAGGSDPGRN